MLNCLQTVPFGIRTQFQRWIYGPLQLLALTAARLLLNFDLDAEVATRARVGISN